MDGYSECMVIPTGPTSTQSSNPSNKDAFRLSHCRKLSLLRWVIVPSVQSQCGAVCKDHQVHPRAPQEHQEHQEHPQELPKSTQEHTNGAPKSTQEHPRALEPPRSTRARSRPNGQKGAFQGTAKRVLKFDLDPPVAGFLLLYDPFLLKRFEARTV